MPSAILDQLETFGPDHCQSLDYQQAHEYTRKLAQSHYENFTVVSWLLPRRLRDDFQHVYAFCRWADDLGDETGDTNRSLQLLHWWRRELDACYAGKPRHPVFVALHQTIQKHAIPRKPFDDLIDAFIQDQHVTRYETFDQVLDYCTRSADPVGRLVLYVCSCASPENFQFSDATCTALQLANFWQDVRRDILERDRVYLPADAASAHGLDLDAMVHAVKLDHASRDQSCGPQGCASCNQPSIGITALLPPYRATIRDLVNRTWPMFEQGRRLWTRVPPDVRLDIQLFTLGGRSILKLIEQQRYDTLTTRPHLSKGAKIALVFHALSGKLLRLGRTTGSAS